LRAQVLEPLGADTAGSQFLQPDGTFPNHIPNPENKEAMAAAVHMVKSSGDGIIQEAKRGSRLAGIGTGMHTMCFKDTACVPSNLLS